MNAVTGYQNLTDRMYLDQDFLPVDIYNIEQKQRINTLSEEITFKSKKEPTLDLGNRCKRFLPMVAHRCSCHFST